MIKKEIENETYQSCGKKKIQDFMKYICINKISKRHHFRDRISADFNISFNIILIKN